GQHKLHGLFACEAEKARGRAVAVKGHASAVVEDARQLGGYAPVEQGVGLVPHQVQTVDLANRGSYPLLECTEFAVKATAVKRGGVAVAVRRGEGLVDEIVAKYGTGVGEVAGGVRRCCGVPFLHSNPTRSGSIGPEAVDGLKQGHLCARTGALGTCDTL